MRLGLLGLLVAAAVSAQDAALLDHVKQKTASNLRRLPNYTCTETIERYLRRRGERNLFPKDVIHVNVAYIEGRELYGRVGDPQIDEPDLERLTGPPIGNGQFASFVKTILGAGGGTFSNALSTTLDNQAAYRFDYEIRFPEADTTFSRGRAALSSVLAGRSG